MSIRRIAKEVLSFSKQTNQTQWLQHEQTILKSVKNIPKTELSTFSKIVLAYGSFEQGSPEFWKSVESTLIQNLKEFSAQDLENITDGLSAKNYFLSEENDKIFASRYGEVIDLKIANENQKDPLFESREKLNLWKLLAELSVKMPFLGLKQEELINHPANIEKLTDLKGIEHEYQIPENEVNQVNQQLSQQFGKKIEVQDYLKVNIVKE